MLNSETSICLDEDKSPHSLFADRSFWGLNLTQFLGAFNDNLFKQLVMLICVDQAKDGGQDWQGVGMILFAWPFIAFSGYAGYLSDRFSKRTIIIVCKVAELIIVLLGLIGFVSGSMTVLLGVLCLMGVHSAFFGPSKYGILPEMLRPSDLPKANGTILMATFLAIIFGLSAAGAAKYAFEKTLWIASLPCLLVALIGLGTALLLRPTPVANPDLKFEWSSVGIAPDTRKLLGSNRTLLGALLMSSVFWFVGGTIYPPAINAYCREQLQLNDLTTGMMAASTGLGIAVGCVLAGILSKDRVRGWLVTAGAWGLTLSLVSLCIPGPGFNIIRDEIHQSNKVGQILARVVSIQEKDTPLESLLRRFEIDFGIKISIRADAECRPDTPVTINLDKVTLRNALDAICRRCVPRSGGVGQNLEIRLPDDSAQSNRNAAFAVQPSLPNRGSFLGPYGSVAALIAVGIFAGFFSVPLQVYLQTTAPADQKGRIIGAFNLFNWFGIAGSGVVYLLGRQVLVGLLEFPHATLFGFAALLMLPVAIFYKPPESQIDATPGRVASDPP